MSDLKVGDRVEIMYHAKSEYTNKLGKISYIGKSLMQGTNPLERNFNMNAEELRFIIILDDNTVLGDIRNDQIRQA